MKSDFLLKEEDNGVLVRSRELEYIIGETTKFAETGKLHSFLRSGIQNYSIQLFLSTLYTGVYLVIEQIKTEILKRILTLMQFKCGLLN